MSPYASVVAWFESLPHGEVRDTVEPMLHVADLMFVAEAAIQTGNAEIIARCKEQLAHGINEFFGWEGKA